MNTNTWFFRVCCKMELSVLFSLPQSVHEKLVDGWKYIAPFFRHAGAHITVRHNPIVVTTQQITGVLPEGCRVYDRFAMHQGGPWRCRSGRRRGCRHFLTTAASGSSLGT